MIGFHSNSWASCLKSQEERSISPRYRVLFERDVKNSSEMLRHSECG